MADSIDEIYDFIGSDVRSDVRHQALSILTDLVSDERNPETRQKCREVLENDPNRKWLKKLINLFIERPESRINVANLLIQLTATYPTTMTIISEFEDGKLLKTMLNSRPRFATVQEAMLLNNLTIERDCAQKALNSFADVQTRNAALNEMIMIVNRSNADTSSETQRAASICAILQNLTQNSDVRQWFITENRAGEYPLEKIISIFNHLTEASDHDSTSEFREEVTVGILHNICLDGNLHEILITKEQLITGLLMPLCGGEQFTDEEFDKMPIDLQYLNLEKKRCTRVRTRQALLESLYALCASRTNREKLRNWNIYLLLREYHKWEKDHGCDLLVGNIISLLIRNEDEINADNLRTDLPISTKLSEKQFYSTINKVTENNKWVS